jgi:hypothetical protein
MKGRKGSVGTLNSKDSKTRTTSSGFRAAAKLAVGLAKGRARAASTAAANDITPPPPPTPVAAPTRSKIVAINVAMNARAPFLAWLRTRGWRQLKPLPGVLKLQSLCATHGAQAMALGAPMATPNAPLAYDVVLASARFVSRKSAFGVLSKSLDAVCVVAIVCMNAPDVEKVVAAFTGVAELAAPGGGWPRGAPKLPHATPCRYVAIYDAADVALARECRDQIEALEGAEARCERNEGAICEQRAVSKVQLDDLPPQRGEDTDGNVRDARRAAQLERDLDAQRVAAHRAMGKGPR